VISVNKRTRIRREQNNITALTIVRDIQDKIMSAGEYFEIHISALVKALFIKS